MRQVLVIGALAFACTAASALERSPRTAPALEDQWSRSELCLHSVSYFNLCSGWAWAWSGFEPGTSISVQYERRTTGWYPCKGFNGYLWTTAIYTWHGSPSGYGFTGTAEIFASDAEGRPIGPPGPTMPWLPATGNAYDIWFDPVPPQFVVVYTTGPGHENPLSVASDAPAGAPGGPPDMGRCYPLDRRSRTHFWGPDQEPSEASHFVDSVGAAELFAAASIYMPYEDGPTSVESTSWGKVKALYR